MKDSHIPRRKSPITLKCDLDFGFAKLSHGFCNQLIKSNICVMFNDHLANDLGDGKGHEIKG